MELVNVAQLAPGQVTATAVTSPHGAVLCPAGFTLTAAAIQRIGDAGVESVVVEHVAHRPDVSRRLEQLDERFADIDDPILLQLKATVEGCLKRLALQGLPAGRQGE